jgi:hypothetical protein
MNGSAYRDDNGADQPETYWRRRAITLVAGLILLGLHAWAFSGGGGKPGHPAAASSSAASSSAATTPAAQTPGVSPPAPASADASASAGADAAVPGLPSAAASGLPSATASGLPSATASGLPSATASGLPSATASGLPAATATAKAGADPVPTSAAAAQSGGDCSPSSVVLSLFSTRPSYSAEEFPEFDIYAVSTAPGTCTLNVGPGQLHLTVMSAGRVIWDSADCSRGGGNQDDQLSRGVPVQESITWNRAITLPGCVTLASSARPGSYQAQVRTGAVASQVRTFKLVR